MPLAAWHEGGFDNSWGHPCTDNGPNSTRVFRRAYYSAVSFTDDNIGKLLGTLDTELGLRNDTVVALMGDHGVSAHTMVHTPCLLLLPALILSSSGCPP